MTYPFPQLEPAFIEKTNMKKNTTKIPCRCGDKSGIQCMIHNPPFNFLKDSTIEGVIEEILFDFWKFSRKDIGTITVEKRDEYISKTISKITDIFVSLEKETREEVGSDINEALEILKYAPKVVNGLTVHFDAGVSHSQSIVSAVTHNKEKE